MAITNKEKYEQLLKSIDWENYRLSGEECDEQHQYLDICDVLWRKLEDLRINILSKNLTSSKDISTIDSIQWLLFMLNEEKLKSII